MAKLPGNADSNASHGLVERIRDEEMELLDSLPMPIRRAIKDAPYDYAVSDIEKAWNTAQQGEFDWDSMTFRRPDAFDFARDMVANFKRHVIESSWTKLENGRYWFTPDLTRRPRRAKIPRHMQPRRL